MNIIGEKVYLRALEEKDCEMLRKLINDPETERLIGGFSFPVSQLAQRDWLINRANTKNSFRCAVVPVSDGNDVAVGTIMLSDIDEKNGTAEIHIKLDRDSGRGKGYGPDAIKALVNYSFKELRIHCIFSNILDSNAISKKVFEGSGFKYEGRLSARVFKDGKYQDLLSYSIVNDKEK